MKLLQKIFIMSVKRRLPSWMAACDPDRGREEPLRSTKRSEPASKKSARKKFPERIMLYWMNERELVETALSVLQKNHVKSDAACPAAATEVSVIPETDTEEEPDSDAQERTRVSDSDVDIAEQETVPYTTCAEKKGLSRRSDSAGDHRPTHSHGLEKEPELEDDCRRTKPDPEALQLVREIFFS